MCQNGYTKCNGTDEHWQGEYQSPDHPQRIIVSSKPGVGDVAITLKDGRTLHIESKKLKSSRGGGCHAMREAIGQRMTGCPDGSDVIPVVAVPDSAKRRNWPANGLATKEFAMPASVLRLCAIVELLNLFRAETIKSLTTVNCRA